MNIKYYLDKVRDSETWELEIVETGEIKTFDILKDAINYVKQDKGKFELLDYWDEGSVYFENGKVYHVSNLYGDDDYLREHYMGVTPKDVEVPDCRHCGDGGCIYCRPNWFI